MNKNTSQSDPIEHFDRVKPLLINVLEGQSGSAQLIREILWSLYCDQPVALARLACLDPDRADAVTALINLRLRPVNVAEKMLEELLQESGEFNRQQEAYEKDRKDGIEYNFYPFVPAYSESLFRMARAAQRREELTSQQWNDLQ